MRCAPAILLAGLALIVLAAALAACPSWLEVDDEDAGGGGDVALLGPTPAASPVVLPSAPADPGGVGPIVPNTPGLRVPRAGYWARARLDVADLVMPYAWASFLVSEDRVTFRLLAARRGVADGVVAVPGLLAVIPISLPAGTDRSQLEGLTLGEQALAAGVVSLRTSRKDRWLVTLTRLSFERVDERLIKGSMEGVARRGARGRRTRSFEMGFLALRSPER